MSNLSKIVVGGTTYDIAGKSLTEGYYYNTKFYKEAAHTTEITGETQKIYVDLATEKIYRWSGSAFVEISAGSDGTTYTLSGETTSSTQQSVKLTPSEGTAQVVPVVGKRTETIVPMGESEMLKVGEVFNNYTQNEASGDFSHAEGDRTEASSYAAHAEGILTVASDYTAHAEGFQTEASYYSAHAEGYQTKATGNSAHSEGGYTQALANYAHAQNFWTKASSQYQTALGKYNVEDANNTYSVIIGNGTAANERSNALAIDWYGNIFCGSDNTSLNAQIAGKQAALTTTQINATSSGITAAKVAQYDKNSAVLPDVIDQGAKNLYKPRYLNFSSRGVVGTFNEATGTLTTTGDFDGSGTFTLNFGTTTLPAGEYVFSCSQGAPSSSGYYGYVANVNSTEQVIAYDYNATTFTLNSETKIAIKGILRQGYSAATFKPFICTKEAWNISQTFVPSGRTNSELTAELKNIIDENKNRVNPLAACGYLDQGSSYPITVGSVVFTLNSDGTITASGSSGSSIRTLKIPMTLPAGTYWVNGCPSGGSSSNYRIDLREPNSATLLTPTADTGSGFTLQLAEETSFDFTFRIAANYTVSQTFKPMICRLSAYKISDVFIPYCPNNRELYEMILALQAGT